MDIIEVVLKLVLAIALGGLIGLEREASQKPAGFRTNILVCVGSAMMMMLSVMIIQNKGGTTDTLVRMAAGVITGIGFLGAGTILHARGTIAGLTTASTIWVVAGLGLVIGAGYYVPAIIFTALTMATLVLFRRVEESYLRRAQFHYHVKFKQRPYILSSLRKLALHHGIPPGKNDLEGGSQVLPRDLFLRRIRGEGAGIQPGSIRPGRYRRAED